jgi:hypothetical protein
VPAGVQNDGRSRPSSPITFPCRDEAHRRAHAQHPRLKSPPISHLRSSKRARGAAETGQIHQISGALAACKTLIRSNMQDR